MTSPLEPEETPRYQAITDRNVHRSEVWSRLDEEQREGLTVVSKVLPFRTNEYVVRELIDWSRVPDDPIYRMTFLQREMLDEESYGKPRVQAAVIRGVGDDAECRPELWRTAVGLGMVPYDMLVERDTGPRQYFEVPRAGSPPLTVVKVGGSLLHGAADLRRAAAAIVERRRGGDAVLVVGSALKGVTDLLELAAVQALAAESANGHLAATLETLRRRHLDVARELGEEPEVADGMTAILDGIDELVGSIRAGEELLDSTHARLLSCGERLSVLLLAAAIRSAGHAAQPLDSEAAGLRATGVCHAGACDLPASAAGLARMRGRLRDRILVLTGFYGVDGAGQVVLFGRGGSDDTACAVAAGLDADRLELWKDVPGFMSADPREVPDARVIEEISFDEVTQLGLYGSSIVHHGCLEPLRGRATRMTISSIGGTQAGAGTRLVERSTRPGARVVALAGRRGSAELRVESAPHNGVRKLACRVLRALVEAGVSTQVPKTEPGAVRLVVADSDLERAWQATGEVVDGRPVTLRRSPPLVAAVGDGVAGDAGIREGMLSCLTTTGIRGELVVEPSSGSGLSCMVHQDDLGPALGGLHHHFFSAPQPLERPEASGGGTR